MLASSFGVETTENYKKYKINEDYFIDD